MSIHYIVGNPGSGKTYLAVHKLYESFILNSEKEPDYFCAYTNINEFDFEASDKIKLLDLDIFRDSLSDLHDLYLDKVSDDELNEKAKELNLHKVLIVIDECHSNIFSEKNDKVLIWWLTYHRHLYQDIWLITQNLSLVDTKYKKIAEFFYKAVDGSNRLFGSRFKYVLFNAPTMYQKRDIVPGGGISLKFNQEVFDLYHSGNKTEHKSYIKYYFLIGLILMIIIFFLYKLFKSNFTSDDQNLTSAAINQPVKTIYQNTNRLKILTDLNITNDEMFAYTLKCYDEKCKILQLEKEIPEKLLEILILDNSLYFFDSKELIKNEFTHFLIFREDVFKFFKHERLNNEKINSFNPILGGAAASSRN